MENKVVMPIDVNRDKSRKRRVVFYGRVSTEHEAQISALQNQLKWYDDVALRHENWKVINKYIDEGITGTQAKKRPSFLQMVNDARQKKFDLIVTREVCRFARNTVDALVVTRELKNIGVEVYFVEDNIWTMDGDGELRLTIMATLAQEESRKTSERVRAGQKISRDKGVLYGNGNILGYNRDKTAGTYIVDSEQAETVRMIYDLYESGMGINLVRDELIKRQRKDSSGLIKWDSTTVGRILRNATYKGYQGYLKSFRNNFLDQKLIRNNDEDTYLYIKGNFEAIISEEQWDRCRAIREQRKRQYTYFTPNGEVTHSMGVRMSNDVWVRKMLCRCGFHFRRNKWRKNESGEIIYGYKCYNQLNNGRKSLYPETSIQVAKSCDLKELCDWKIELMAKHIFSSLWGDKKDILDNVSSIYKFDSREKTSEEIEMKAKYEQEIVYLQDKVKKLTRMRIEDEISKEEFVEMKNELESKREDIVKKRTALEMGDKTDETEFNPSQKIEDFLQEKMNFSGTTVDRDILMQFVDTVIPRTEESFDWYLDFDLEKKPIEEKAKYWEFSIEFEEAQKYKKARNGLLRTTQWKDLHVRVFI